MANNETQSHEDEAERLQELLEEYTRNELCELNRRLTVGHQQPKRHDPEHVSDEEHNETSKMMHFDAILEAADLESGYIETKYGTADAAAICSHMAVSTNMREYYRGDLNVFKENLFKDVECLSEMYIEPILIERQHYIDRIMFIAGQSKKSGRSCEVCECSGCKCKDCRRAE